MLTLTTTRRGKLQTPGGEMPKAKAKSKRKLPNILYAAWDGDGFLTADKSQDELAVLFSDNTVLEVGMYELVSAQRYTKELVEVD